MKKILLLSYNYLNLGDDLFVKIICERYSDHQFYIFSNIKYSKPYKSIENLTVFPLFTKLSGGIRRLFPGILINDILFNKVAKRCDTIVNIGGSIFMENSNWETDLELYKNKIKNKKPFFVIGSNFGPYSSAKFLAEYKEVFSTMTSVCFRDQESYNLFKDLQNVNLASDVVFSLKIPRLTKKKQIVISVIDVSFRKDLFEIENEYISKINEIINTFARKGYDVVLMGFCKEEGDSKVIKKIMTNVDIQFTDKIKKYEYSGNLDEAIGIINESKIVIASRFHAMILGWVCSCNVLPLIYSNKMLNVLEDMSYSNDYFHINEIAKLNPENIFNKLDKSYEIDISNEIKSSLIQFKELDEFLEQIKEEKI